MLAVVAFQLLDDLGAYLADIELDSALSVIGTVYETSGRAPEPLLVAENGSAVDVDAPANGFDASSSSD